MSTDKKINENIKQFVLYLIVGGLATIVEWIFFYLFNLKLHYTVATALAFIVSTFANWFFGKIILFKKKEKSVLKELISIYGTSIIGLLLNLLIMWILVDKFALWVMLSKIIATGIVFVWNFLVRKFLIYKI